MSSSPGKCQPVQIVILNKQLKMVQRIRATGRMPSTPCGGRTLSKGSCRRSPFQGQTASLEEARSQRLRTTGKLRFRAKIEETVREQVLEYVSPQIGISWCAFDRTRSVQDATSVA